MHRKTRIPRVPVAQLVALAVLVALAAGLLVGLSALGSPAAAQATGHTVSVTFPGHKNAQLYVP